jgi:hypothetical protein
MKKSKFFPLHVRKYLEDEKNLDAVTDFKTKLRSTVNGSVIVIDKKKPLKLLDLAGVSEDHDKPKKPVLPWPAPFEECDSCAGMCSMDKPEQTGSAKGKGKSRFAYRDEESEDEEIVLSSPKRRPKNAFEVRKTAMSYLKK